MDLSLAIVWKRFIDDILVFIRSRDKSVQDSFVDRVQSHFKDYGLDITVRSLNPAHPEHDKNGILIDSIEFLDVNHSFDSADHMQTGLFVKPTAQNSTYLHPSSYHPKSISPGILKGELIRVRKLSSNDRQFEIGAQEIFNKAKRSSFTNKAIDTAKDMIKTWDIDKRIELLTGKINTTKTKSLTWVTKLPVCIKKKFEYNKEYLPKDTTLRVAYQKPLSLRAICFKPRSLEVEAGEISICGSCKTCGNHSKGINMVATGSTLEVKIKNKHKKFKINSKLDCNSSGIYVAKCTQHDCHDTYVGQTSKPFRTRISQHRSKWTTGAETYRDDTALLDHYREFHFEVYQNWCNNKAVQVGFDQAFKLYFVDKVGDNLSKQEDFWQKRLSSRINRCNIITPAIIY